MSNPPLLSTPSNKRNGPRNYEPVVSLDSNFHIFEGDSVKTSSTLSSKNHPENNNLNEYLNTFPAYREAQKYKQMFEDKQNELLKYFVSQHLKQKEQS